MAVFSSLPYAQTALISTQTAGFLLEGSPLGVQRLPGFNPYGLLEAYSLYKNSVYRELAAKVGIENLYILSAGWGLVRSTFLLPMYDITFSSSGPPCTRRAPGARYLDFRHLSAHGGDRVLYFGGKSYLPALGELTKPMPRRPPSNIPQKCRLRSH